MQEIYKNVREEVKTVAEFAWSIALALKDSNEAATFLDNVTKYFSNSYTEEEVEFLRFYFNMQMEMMKE